MKMIDADITRAATLEGDFYTSDTNFKDSVENIFARNWQFISDVQRLKENRSALPFRFLGDLLPEPLLLVSNEGEIHCFSNVCTHRGNLLINNPCTIKRDITCSYHGRQFDICGKFKFMPKTEGMQNFPTVQDDLTKVSVARWRQFIFTSLSPEFEFDAEYDAWRSAFADGAATTLLHRYDRNWMNKVNNPKSRHMREYWNEAKPEFVEELRSAEVDDRRNQLTPDGERDGFYISNITDEDFQISAPKESFLQRLTPLSWGLGMVAAFLLGKKL